MGSARAQCLRRSPRELAVQDVQRLHELRVEGLGAGLPLHAMGRPPCANSFGEPSPGIPHRVPLHGCSDVVGTLPYQELGRRRRQHIFPVPLAEQFECGQAVQKHAHAALGGTDSTRNRADGPAPSRQLREHAELNPGGKHPRCRKAPFEFEKPFRFHPPARGLPRDCPAGAKSFLHCLLLPIAPGSPEVALWQPMVLHYPAATD